MLMSELFNYHCLKLCFSTKERAALTHIFKDEVYVFIILSSHDI